MTLGTTAPVQVSAPSPSLDKGKQKEVRFDKLLKKDPPKGLNAPFCFDILAHLANILARMTLYKLLCLSKEIRKALRDALTDLKTFLTQVPAIPIDDDSIPSMSFGATTGAIHYLHI